MKDALGKLLSENNIKRIKELFRYGIVGLSTTIINLLTFHILIYLIDYRISNLIALVISKTYGYFANKKIVFHSKTETFAELMQEVIRYIAARGFTAVVDYFGLLVAVEIFHFDKIVSKYAIQVVVIILNYVLGRFMVFNKTKEVDREGI